MVLVVDSFYGGLRWCVRVAFLVGSVGIGNMGDTSICGDIM